MTKTELNNALSRLPREQIDGDLFSFCITGDMEVHYYNDSPILVYIIKIGFIYVLSLPDKTAVEHIKSVCAESINSGTLNFVLYDRCRDESFMKEEQKC